MPEIVGVSISFQKVFRKDFSFFAFSAILTLQTRRDFHEQNLYSFGAAGHFESGVRAVWRPQRGVVRLVLQGIGN